MKKITQLIQLFMLNKQYKWQHDFQGEKNVKFFKNHRSKAIGKEGKEEKPCQIGDNSLNITIPDLSYPTLPRKMLGKENNREREAETQAEGEAGSTQGAQCETPSQVSRMRPWAEGGAKPLSYPG